MKTSGRDTASSAAATATDTATVTATDIARLAGVGRAAVSNWRRRFADFPAPVGGTSTSPLFALTSVADWLTRHDRPFQVEAADQVWQRIRGAVDDPRLGEVTGHLGGFLIQRQRDPAGATALLGESDAVAAVSLEPAIARAVPELPGGFPDTWETGWVAIARVAAEAADRHGHAELFDALRARYREVCSRQVAKPPRAVGELMVTLAGLRGRAGAATVLDPACGIGGLLEAARAAGAGRLLGQDVNPTMARVSAVGLLLRGGDARIVAGDSLLAGAFAGERANAVLCAPPFGQRSWGYDELLGAPWWRHGVPPRGEPELAWVQYCLAHARDGAPVLVIMPAAAASRRAGRRIRANLLRAGELRAVLGLPPGLFPTGSAPDLWVLRRGAGRGAGPDAGPDAGSGGPGATSAQVLLGLAHGEIAVVEAAWALFVAAGGFGGGTADLPAGFRRMCVADLLDDEVDVSPRGYIDHPPERTAVGEFPAVREDFLAMVASLSSAVPLLTPPRGSGPADRLASPSVTIGELAKAGSLTVLMAPLQTRAGVGDLPLLTAGDVRHGRGPSGRTEELAGMLVLRPGDVVCVTAPGETTARVVEDAGAVLGPRVVLLRGDPDRLDPYFLAGILRPAGHPAHGRSGGGADAQAAGRSGGSSPPAGLRRVRIPVLPLAEQRSRGLDFHRLTMVEKSLRDAVELAETIVRLGHLGIADGSLRGGATGPM
ncbi:HsdM family class I SAM-dependent methyltransferase [Frankia sp. CcWB2]